MIILKNANKFLTCLALGVYTFTVAQQLEYKNTFDNFQTGVYDTNTAKKAFGVNFFKGAEEGRVAITNFENKGNVLRAFYPKGKVKTNDSGFHTKLFWDNESNEKHEALYLSYNIYIPKDFEFRAGAKIPGLAYQTKDRNMSVRLMWRRDGRLEYYNHFNTRPTWKGWSASVDWSLTGPYTDLVNGKVQADQAKLIKGQWNHIELYNKLNTPGENDGVMRAWLNGELAIDIVDNQDYRQADEADIGLNCIYLSTFFGGSDETYQPTKDQYAYFDDFIISKTRIGFNEELLNNPVEINENPIEEVVDEIVEEEIEEQSTTEVVTEDTSLANCTFSTPSPSPLVTLNRMTYNNVHLLGSGGPDVSKFSKFRINWNAVNSKLNQFAFNTTNGIPSYYIDLRAKSTYSFGNPNPSITILNSGITGLDGEYWVTVSNSDFVMVSKNKDFTMYFNNSTTAPNCNQLSSKSIEKAASNSIRLYPNPVTNNLHIKNSELAITEFEIINLQGQVMWKGANISNLDIDVSSLIEGMYFLKYSTANKQESIPFVKLK